MKKHTLVGILLAMVIILSITTPVIAIGKMEPVGERIFVRGGEREFPAGTPFHIWHGWVQPSTDSAIGIFDFTLEMDGVLINNYYKDFYADSGNPDLLCRKWVYNFPDGLTGTHTFTKHLYAPCQYAVDQLGFTGPCATPNEKVETFKASLTVVFVP